MWNVMESNCPKHFRFIHVKSIFSVRSCIELTYMLGKVDLCYWRGWTKMLGDWVLNSTTSLPATPDRWCYQAQRLGRVKDRWGLLKSWNKTYYMEIGYNMD